MPPKPNGAKSFLTNIVNRIYSNSGINRVLVGRGPILLVWPNSSTLKYSRSSVCRKALEYHKHKWSPESSYLSLNVGLAKPR